MSRKTRKARRDQKKPPAFHHEPAPHWWRPERAVRGANLRLSWLDEAAGWLDEAAGPPPPPTPDLQDRQEVERWLET